MSDTKWEVKTAEHHHETSINLDCDDGWEPLDIKIVVDRWGQTIYLCVFRRRKKVCDEL